MSTTDKELLELAAKAVGLKYHAYVDSELFGHGINTGELDTPLWNPLKDDGDAMRLAMKLGLRVDMNYRPNPASGVGVGVWTPGDIEFYPPFWQIDAKDLARAVRGTIVRAAAELGRAKEAA